MKVWVEGNALGRPISREEAGWGKRQAEGQRTLVADSTLTDLGPGVTLDKAKTLGSRVAAKCKQAGIGDRVVG